MGGSIDQHQNLRQTLKEAICQKLKSLEPPMKWMTANGLARYFSQQEAFKSNDPSSIISSLLIEALLFEMEKSSPSEIRRSALPSKKSLDVLWGSKFVVGNKQVMPVEKQEIQDDFFGDSHFVLNENTKKCFLSHSHKDVKESIVIGKTLLKYNIYPWMAETDIAYDMSINYEIQQAINTADYFLIYVTENALSSVWTEKELGFAQGKKRLIVANKEGFEQIISAENLGFDDHGAFYNQGAERLKVDGESISMFLDMINTHLATDSSIGMLDATLNSIDDNVSSYTLKSLDDYLNDTL